MSQTTSTPHQLGQSSSDDVEASDPRAAASLGPSAATADAPVAPSLAPSVIKATSSGPVTPPGSSPRASHGTDTPESEMALADDALGSKMASSGDDSYFDAGVSGEDVKSAPQPESPELAAPILDPMLSDLSGLFNSVELRRGVLHFARDRMLADEEYKHARQDFKREKLASFERLRRLEIDSAQAIASAREKAAVAQKKAYSVKEAAAIAREKAARAQKKAAISQKEAVMALPQALARADD